MAAKEKISRLMAWLAPILLLLAALAAAQPASALTCGALETRAWEKTPAPLESRLDESLQLLNLHQQNGGAGYDDALGSPLAAKGAAADEQYVNLASGERTGHILYGDRPGSGGHMWPGMDGKTPFPESWSAPKIMHEVSDIVTDPSVKWQNLTGSQGSLFTKAGNPARWGATAVRDGVKVFVVYEPAGEGIITAYPVK